MQVFWRNGTERNLCNQSTVSQARCRVTNIHDSMLLQLLWVSRMYISYIHVCVIVTKMYYVFRERNDKKRCQDRKLVWNIFSFKQIQAKYSWNNFTVWSNNKKFTIVNIFKHSLSIFWNGNYLFLTIIPIFFLKKVIRQLVKWVYFNYISLY